MYNTTQNHLVTFQFYRMSSMANHIESKDIVYGLKVSSVGPGKVTGSDVIYEPSNVDLAMKLHYHRVVYLFDSRATELAGLTVPRFKEAAFTWLNYYYESCGRFRRFEQTGRPYIKCNDCGVRFIEAKSSRTVQDWVQLNRKDSSYLRLLVPDPVLGPELTFSPTVFIQITYLECGGVAVGLSCAHVLGDFFSASEYMNLWARILSGYKPTHKPNLNKLKAHDPKSPKPKGPEAQLLKRVDPVGDHWIATSPSKMGTFSFHLTSTQLDHLQTMVLGPNGSSPSPYFETLCGVIWWAVAQGGDGPELNRVTIITKDTCDGEIREKNKEIMRNTQVLSVVKADFAVRDAHPRKLAQLIRHRAVDERAQVSGSVASEPGASDFLVYGANLTFVNLEGVNCYGFVLKGHQPCLVNYFIDGMGEVGAVFVLPGPDKGDGKAGVEGRLVTMILPEDQMLNVRKKLAKEWSIANA